MPRSRWAFVVTLSAVAIHVVVALVTSYGIHRDEFLYMAMGRHLSLWQMDFPPFIAMAANLELLLTGGELRFRLLPAIAHALLVFVGVESTRLLGGRSGAQVVSALAILLPPLFMRSGSLLQPVVFDQLWWSLALLALLKLRDTANPRWWLAVGAALGMGLLTKFSIAFIAVGIAAAAIVSRRRGELLTRWPWLAAVVTLLLGSPSIAGQIALGWPLLGQMSELQSTQLERVSTGQFLLEQPLMLGGPAFVLAMAGVVWLFVSIEVRWARGVAIATSLAFLLVMLAHGKPYYIGPIYPVLIAAGAAMTQRVWDRRTRALLQASAAAAIVIAGVVTFPMGAPVLGPEPMMRYTSALGIATVTQTNRGEQIDLPQDYADMLGWERLADTVSHVYMALPAVERAQAVVLADNYGRAGALEYYAQWTELPDVVSAAGSYWFFGPGERAARVIIVVGDGDDLPTSCGSVTRAAVIEDALLVPEERRVEVHICRGPVQTLQDAWASLRPVAAR